MLDGGMVTDIITFSTLINGFCEAGKLDVQKLFYVLAEKKMCIQIRTCNIMIDGLCKGRKLDEAEALMTKWRAMVAVPMISLAILWSKLFFRSMRFPRLCNTLK